MMKNKSRIAAFLIAILMTVFPFACGETEYVLISDPYFTDGVNKFDLSGLTVSLSAARSESLVQLIAAAVTSAEKTDLTLEIDTENVRLFASGFSSVYHMDIADLEKILSGAGISSDVNKLIQGLFAKRKTSDADGIGIRDLISMIYAMAVSDSSMLDQATKGKISTFVHEDMSAFCVPVEITEEQLDELLLSLLKGLEPVLMEMSQANGDDYQEGELSALYTEILKPLKLSLSGDIYFGENDVFAEVFLFSEGVPVIPVYVEITNTETPAIYVNIPIAEENGDEILVYATVEADIDGYKEYAEIGVMRGEQVLMMALYTDRIDESTGAPLFEGYVSFLVDGQVCEFSGVYTSDEASFRTLWMSGSFKGMQAELAYQGTIQEENGGVTEEGKLQLASNLGISGNLSFLFGRYDDLPEPEIPADDTVGKASILTLDEAGIHSLQKDLSSLLSKLEKNLSENIPGFRNMIGAFSKEPESEG